MKEFLWGFFSISLFCIGIATIVCPVYFLCSKYEDLDEIFIIMTVLSVLALFVYFLSVNIGHFLILEYRL